MTLLTLDTFDTFGNQSVQSVQSVEYKTVTARTDLHAPLGRICNPAAPNMSICNAFTGTISTDFRPPKHRKSSQIRSPRLVNVKNWGENFESSEIFLIFAAGIFPHFSKNSKIVHNMDCNDIAYRSLRKDKNMPPHRKRGRVPFTRTIDKPC